MGRVTLSSEIFNCSPPDAGNMETIERYGTAEQKERWLRPLLEGEIRSAFAMTEPDVASSDATNVRTNIQREGGDYVINGRKWYVSGAGARACKLLIVMRSEEHTSELQSLMRISYAVFCLKKKKYCKHKTETTNITDAVI